MSPGRGKLNKPVLASAFWGSLIFFSIGLYCLGAPEVMLSTLDHWALKQISNPRLFGYAIGSIFIGGAIVFHANGYLKHKGLSKLSTCGIVIGACLLLIGFAYVLWSIGLPT